MATIKMCTDIPQSKVLSHILPLESADMYYDGYKDALNDEEINYQIDFVSNWTSAYPNKSLFEKSDDMTIPCWSLAALLGVLPKNLNIGRPSLEFNYKGYYCIQYYDEFMKPNNYKTECFNNPIDTCYEMIIKLNELNML